MIARYSGDANYDPVSGACGDAGEQVVVGPATPVDRDAGRRLDDRPRRFLHGYGDGDRRARWPTPDGDVTSGLRPERRDVHRCAGVHVGQPTAHGRHRRHRRRSRRPRSGTYRVIARYSGDANNDPVSGACGDAGEQVVVGPAAPADRDAGQRRGDRARRLLHGYGDGDRRARWPGAGRRRDFEVCTARTTRHARARRCSRRVNRPLTGGTATSASFTPTAVGTYRWIARYSGDANNDPVSGACGDTGEQVVVAATARRRSRRSLRRTCRSVAASPTTRRSPVASTRWRARRSGSGLYGPNDATCSGAVAFDVDGALSARRGARHVGAVHADGGGHVPLARSLQRGRQQRAGRGSVQRLQRERHRAPGDPGDHDDGLSGRSRRRQHLRQRDGDRPRPARRRRDDPLPGLRTQRRDCTGPIAYESIVPYSPRSTTVTSGVVHADRGRYVSLAGALQRRCEQRGRRGPVQRAATRA